MILSSFYRKSPFSFHANFGISLGVNCVNKSNVTLLQFIPWVNTHTQLSGFKTVRFQYTTSKFFIIFFILIWLLNVSLEIDISLKPWQKYHTLWISNESTTKKHQPESCAWPLRWLLPLPYPSTGLRLCWRQGPSSLQWSAKLIQILTWKWVNEWQGTPKEETSVGQKIITNTIFSFISNYAATTKKNFFFFLLSP